MTASLEPVFADLRKVLEAVDPPTRRMVWFALALGFLAGILQSIGVGAVAPLVILSTDPEALARLPFIAALVPQWLAEDPRRLVAAALTGFAALFVFTTAVTLSVTFVQARTIGRLSAQLASRLFADYLRQPFQFHLHRNVADVSTRLFKGVDSAVVALYSVSHIVVEGAAVLFIAAVLLYADAKVALITIAAIALPGWLAHRTIRKRLRRAGEEFHLAHTRALGATLDAWAGIKELKVLGREDAFGRIHAGARRRLGELQAAHAVLQGAPRAVLELAAVLGVLVLVGVQQFNAEIAQIAPLLGLYIAAIFRLLPAANRLIVAGQTLRYSEAGLRRVSEDIKSVLPTIACISEATDFRFRSAIEIRDLSFRYDSGRPFALRNVSLTIAAGQCVGITGPSGAGKTTLIDLLLGLLTPADGQIAVDGRAIGGCTRAWQRRIGYVPQSVYLTDDSIARNVAFARDDSEVSEERVWRALGRAQLAEFVAGLPAGLGTVVGERGVRMSGGQRQRIGIARALYDEPDILVLDEATSALDDATETEVLRAVEALHGTKTIVIVAHRLSTVQKCDRVVVMEAGEIVADGFPKGRARQGSRASPSSPLAS